MGTKVTYHQIPSKFDIVITLIKLSFKFNYGFCQTNDNQDGQQNGRHQSVCICGHATLVLHYMIAVKFHIWTTIIKVLLMFQYDLCLITQMATKMAAKCLTWSFVTQFPPIFIYRLPSSNYCSSMNMDFIQDGRQDQESLQSITTPDPGYQWESDNVTIRHHKREPITVDSYGFLFNCIMVDQASG